MQYNNIVVLILTLQHRRAINSWNLDGLFYERFVWIKYNLKKCSSVGFRHNYLTGYNLNKQYNVLYVILLMTCLLFQLSTFNSYGQSRAVRGQEAYGPGANVTRAPKNLCKIFINTF